MRKPKTLEALFAKAGRAEARRRAADARGKAESRRQAKRNDRRRRNAEARAPIAAEQVFSWVQGEDAERLRGCLVDSGLRAVTLLAWVTGEGHPLPAATFGAWRVSLTPSGLWVHRIGAPMGGRSRGVESPAALLDLVPAYVIAALALALSSGSYERTVRAHLRERTRLDAESSNIIQLGI